MIREAFTLAPKPSWAFVRRLGLVVLISLQCAGCWISATSPFIAAEDAVSPVRPGRFVWCRPQGSCSTAYVKGDGSKYIVYEWKPDEQVFAHTWNVMFQKFPGRKDIYLTQISNPSQYNQSYMAAVAVVKGNDFNVFSTGCGDISKEKLNSIGVTESCGLKNASDAMLVLGTWRTTMGERLSLFASLRRTGD